MERWGHFILKAPSVLQCLWKARVKHITGHESLIAINPTFFFRSQKYPVVFKWCFYHLYSGKRLKIAKLPGQEKLLEITRYWFLKSLVCSLEVLKRNLLADNTVCRGKCLGAGFCSAAGWEQDTGEGSGVKEENRRKLSLSAFCSTWECGSAGGCQNNWDGRKFGLDWPSGGLNGHWRPRGAEEDKIFLPSPCTAEHFQKDVLYSLSPLPNLWECLQNQWECFQNPRGCVGTWLLHSLPPAFLHLSPHTLARMGKFCPLGHLVRRRRRNYTLGNCWGIHCHDSSTEQG